MAGTSQSSTLIDSLVSLKDGLNKGDASARAQAIEISRKLQAELEVPAETLVRVTWAEPTHLWVLHTAQDLNIYQVLSEGDGSPKTATQIAERVKADPILIGRLMRHLASMNSIKEVGPDKYTHGNFSKYLTTHSADSTVKFMRWFSSVQTKTPEYLAEKNYISPSGLKNAPWSWAKGLGEVSWFEWLSQQPVYGPLFGAMMEAQLQAKPAWSDGNLYPVKEKLRSVEGSDDVLLVDVGGGNGLDITQFHRNNPELKGRLVLQDLPYVIDHVKIEGVEAMAHDFFTEQPVKGAQVYFMHQIMHDYEDENCIKILRHLVSAMKPGYSRILINDLVIPDQDAHWYTTTMDLIMMQTLCNRERTKAQFIDLINQVGNGLRVDKVWTPVGAGPFDSLIECVIDA